MQRRLTRSANLLMTVSYVSFIIQRHRQGGVRVVPLRGTRTVIPSGAVKGKGRIRIGDIWSGTRNLRGYLTVRKGGSITIDGYFSIFSGCRIDIFPGGHLEIDSGYINTGSRISCFELIRIGNDTLIGENVVMADSDQHQVSASRSPVTAPIVIGSRVWIGAGVTILKGITIGDGAVIGAASVVTKDVPAGTLVAGNPARVIRQVEWQ